MTNRILILCASLCWSVSGFAKEARTIRIDDKRSAKVFVSYGRTTVLNFPAKPTKVILGNRGAFAVEYVDNDLAIAPLVVSAKSNLFVYLPGRRFALDLVPNANSDELIFVRDPIQEKVTVKIK